MYKPFADGIEVHGTSISSVVSALTSINFILKKIFSEVGLPDPDEIEPQSWYPQQCWLNAFKLIEEKAGPHTLMIIGEKIPEYVEWPLEVTDIESALTSIDVAYHMNHRNAQGQVLYNNGSLLEGIGHYTYYKFPDEKKIIISCENPYNCDFDRGIIYKMGKKFEPGIKIEHDASLGCRKLGDEFCIYTVYW